MQSKQVEITCPCCSGRLLVDVLTGKVLRSRPREVVDEQGKPVVGEADWTQAVGKVKQRLETQGDRMQQALEREKDKEARLDELFRKASEKLDEEKAD
jgi:hypothetical protein